MTHFSFEVAYRRDKARIGTLETPHGCIQTPVFMPVGTQGTIKSVLPSDLWDTGTRIALSNTYHLYLRPGAETVKAAGGIHSFMNWPGAVLTDSGGFQILSLGHLLSLNDEGVTFRSHIDGRLIRFTPEDAVQAQLDIGADIIMPLDQPSPYPASFNEAKEAAERTVRWARRAKNVDVPARQALFGIVQGSVYPELRQGCAADLMDIDFPGYALGGLSVGEPKEVFYEITEATTSVLPDSKPRYLMGVGHPVDIIEGVLAGVDMFDCVLPTRNARHGRAFTFLGPLNLKNARFAQDNAPIEEGCDCHACQGFSRAYIRHLLQAEESLAWTLLTLHNLRFFQRFMNSLRRALQEGSQLNFLEKMRKLYP